MISDPKFSDTSYHWARDCIAALAARQIINGYPAGTFRPKARMSRAEFAALMPKVFAQLPVRQPAAAFSDVFEGHWASGAIAWASERGLFGGYPDGLFRPQRTISRVQAIVALMAGLEAAQGVDVALSQSVDLTAANFSDAADIPAYARGAISAALERQFLEALPEPRPLRPNQAITRGDVAALLCRALEIPSGLLIQKLPAFAAAEEREAVFQQLLQQETGFNAEKLAFLDRGIARSPYRAGVSQTALRLQTPEDIPTPLSREAAYPPTGEVYFVNEGGLEFLSPDVLSGCVCLATERDGELAAHWLGRDALVERQMWSSTKFIPLLNVIARANAHAPEADIDQCRVRRAGSAGRGYRFNELATGIMSYDNRIATSNALAVMFKQFEVPERLEKWTQQLTGNPQLSFQGRYGEVPFIQQPELWHTQRKQVLLKAAAQPHHNGQNLVSTYDLTRLLSMIGWHWQLPIAARVPNVQGHSLESLMRAMAVDTARYVEVAFETLGLTPWVRSPAIMSKSGFGHSDERRRTELTYSALVQFSLPRRLPQNTAPDPTAAYQRYALCFTLMAAQDVGDADDEARYVDALMAASVTELIRRTVMDLL